MTAILKVVLGFVAEYWAYIAAAALVVGIYFWIDGLIDDRDKAIAALQQKTVEFETFKTTTAALGKAAQDRADQQMIDDKKRKEVADALLINIRSQLTDALGQLRRNREERARGGYLPPAAPNSPNPDRAEIIRSKFERAMGYLDAGGSEIAARGDDSRVGLDAAKTWADGATGGGAAVVTDPPPR